MSDLVRELRRGIKEDGFEPESRAMRQAADQLERYEAFVAKVREADNAPVGPLNRWFAVRDALAELYG